MPFGFCTSARMKRDLARWLSSVGSLAFMIGVRQHECPVGTDAHWAWFRRRRSRADCVDVAEVRG